MIPELGHFALILALCVCLLQGILPVLGAHNGRREWTAAGAARLHRLLS
jgi:cytochrome c-type biogenesis protein CcmF